MRLTLKILTQLVILAISMYVTDTHLQNSISWSEEGLVSGDPAHDDDNRFGESARAKILFDMQTVLLQISLKFA